MDKTQLPEVIEDVLAFCLSFVVIFLLVLGVGIALDSVGAGDKPIINFITDNQIAAPALVALIGGLGAYVWRRLMVGIKAPALAVEKGLSQLAEAFHEFVRESREAREREGKEHDRIWVQLQNHEDRLNRRALLRDEIARRVEPNE